MNNIYNKVFVKCGFIENLDVAEDLPLDDEYSYQLESNDIKLVEEGWVVSPSLISDSLLYYDGSKWVDGKDLKENEVVLNVNQLIAFDSSDYREKLTTYINQNLSKTQLEAEKEFFEEYIKKYNVIGKKLSLSIQKINTSGYEEEFNDLVVVGITGLITNNERYYYLSFEQVGKYKKDPISVTGVLVFENTQSGFKKLMDEFPYDQKISLKSTYSYDVLDMIRVVDIFKEIAFYIGIAFLVFAIILIANFMFSSISYRKKEIGILRGLGARNGDVTKIFLWEGITLASISFILTSILLVLATNFLNNFIMTGTDMLLTPFIITIRQLLLYLFLFMLLCLFQVFFQ